MSQNASTTVSTSSNVSSKAPRYFPNEIWLSISKYATHSCRKELRQVNKNLNAVASQEIFRVVYVTTLPDSLAKLEAISNHATLRMFVEEIIYISGRLRNGIMTVDDWTYAAGLPQNERSILTQNPPELDRYNELFNAQASLRQSGSDMTILARCLETLPMLTLVEVVKAGTFSRRFCGSIPIGTRFHKETSLQMAENLYSSPRATEDADTLAVFLEASQVNRSKLKTLVLGELPWPFWQSTVSMRGSDLTSTPSTMSRVQPHLKNALLHLTSLTMSTWLGKRDQEKDGEQAGDNLATFLEAAPQLRLLNLTLLELMPYANFLDGEEPSLMMITKVFQKVRWDNLTTLRLTACSSSRESFQNFMLYHAKSLRDLSILLFTMTDSREDERHTPSWEYAVKEIHQSLNLQEIALTYLDDASLRIKMEAIKDGSERSVREIFEYQLGRYLLHRGHDMHFPIFGLPILPSGCSCVFCREDGDPVLNFFLQCQST